jgi:hypothetical protein
MNPNRLVSAREAARILGIGKGAWMSRLWSAHMGVKRVDAKGKIVRSYRGGHRLKPVSGPLYGWTTNQFRLGEVLRFGSLLRTRGGRISTLIEGKPLKRLPQKPLPKAKKAPPAPKPAESFFDGLWANVPRRPYSG